MSAILNTYNRKKISFSKGKGAFLYGTNGKKYLDYASGIAVNAFGHCHPKLVEALQDQASKLWHTSNLYRILEQEKVAEKLVANSCADRVFFCNSGLEANEAAIKIARLYGKNRNFGKSFQADFFCGITLLGGNCFCMYVWSNFSAAKHY